MNKLVREITRLLTATGQPYELRNTSRHVEVYLIGEKIATVSHGGARRDTLKVQSAIRTCLRRAGK